MGMSDFYGPADEAESIATIQAALDAGITLLDTGDYYAAGHNELLIREALRGREREQAVISVFETTDPRATARAVFDATSRFHNPANAATWSDPEITVAYDGVRALVLRGLTCTSARRRR